MERLNTDPDLRREGTLDPKEWSETRELSYRMIDDAVAYLRDGRCHVAMRKARAGLRLTHFQAAATASRHVVIAAARSTR